MMMHGKSSKNFVKPVIAALSELTDADDWRGVGKAMVRCRALVDKHPDLLP